MADENGQVGWYSVDQRALFPLTGIHVSRSLWRTFRLRPYSISFDCAFEDVMRSCMRPGENWINEVIIRAFTLAHVEGWAHSCEVWNAGRLAGGIYGLALGSCFSAESMFHRETDASKVALHAMVEKCRLLGFTMFDAQVMNPHLASLGAFEIPHHEYLLELEMAQLRPNTWSRPR